MGNPLDLSDVYSISNVSGLSEDYIVAKSHIVLPTKARVICCGY